MRGGRVTATVATRKAPQKGAGDAELDLHLHRLLFFSDGGDAIALTLHAAEPGLPEAGAALRGRHLLDSWPKVLAFLTSFVFIANFWAGHNIL